MKLSIFKQRVRCRLVDESLLFSYSVAHFKRSSMKRSNHLAMGFASAFFAAQPGCLAYSLKGIDTGDAGACVFPPGEASLREEFRDAFIDLVALGDDDKAALCDFDEGDELCVDQLDVATGPIAVGIQEIINDPCASVSPHEVIDGVYGDEVCVVRIWAPVDDVEVSFSVPCDADRDSLAVKAASAGAIPLEGKSQATILVEPSLDKYAVYTIMFDHGEPASPEHEVSSWACGEVDCEEPKAFVSDWAEVARSLYDEAAGR